LQTRLDLLPFAVATIAADRPTLIIVGEAVAPPGMVMAQVAGTNANAAQR